MITCSVCKLYKNDCPKNRKKASSKPCKYFERNLVLTKKDLQDFLLHHAQIRAIQAEFKLSKYQFEKSLNKDQQKLYTNFISNHQAQIMLEEKYKYFINKITKELGLDSLEEYVIDDKSGKVRHMDDIKSKDQSKDNSKDISDNNKNSDNKIIPIK